MFLQSNKNQNKVIPGSVYTCCDSINIIYTIIHVKICKKICNLMRHKQYDSEHTLNFALPNTTTFGSNICIQDEVRNIEK